MSHTNTDHQRTRESILKKNMLNNQLIAMAADSEVQSELNKINKEVLVTELDGLETPT